MRRLLTPTATVLCCILTPLAWWAWQLGPMRPGGDVSFFNYDQFHYSLPHWRYAVWMLLHRGILPLWDPYQ